MAKKSRLQDIRSSNRWYERTSASTQAYTRSDVSVPQMLIVRRYLTQEPDLDASRELLDLVNMITKTDKESFIGAFNDWHEKYKEVLNERVHDKRIKRHTPPYMRPRLRSAYLSLKRNMPLLWTFYDYPETGLPNTNNGLEGLFSDLKSKVRVHSGLSKDHRKKLLDEYIMRHY